MAGRTRGLGLGLRRRGLLGGHAPVSGRTRLPHFVAHGDTAEENVAAFVRQARDNPCWLGHVDFDQDCWDVTETVARRPGRPHEPCARRLCFCRTRKLGVPAVPLPPCVKDFCKAVVRQTRGARFHVLKTRIEACQYLGGALEAQKCVSISECTVAVLDAAADLARSRLRQARAYIVAGQIRIIARFLDEHRMTRAPVGDWSPATACCMDP